MYKSVSFNIFEEHLQEIVYEKNSFPLAENKSPDKKTVVVIGEVTVPKITIQESSSFISKNLDWKIKEILKNL